MLLEQINRFGFVDEDVESEYQDLMENVTSICEDIGMTAPGSDIKMPYPGMADDTISRQDYPEQEDIESTMAVIIKQMEAAKKGMAILNKMGDSPFRTKNKSRVLGNLNRIRGSLQRVTKMMEEPTE